MATRARGRRRRTAGIVAASVLAHLAVFLALFSHLGTAPRHVVAPVMNVEILTRPPAAKPPPRRTAARRQGATSKAAPPPQQIVPHPTPPAPSQVAPSAVPGRALGDPVQATLRGLAGCSEAALAHLPPAQREACEQRLARNRMADLGPRAAGLNLDVGGFGKDPQAYLERRPGHGCKPRAGGDVGPMGKIGAAAGIACAKSF